MSRIQFLAVAAVLALGYTAANAVDAALADLPRLTRMIDTAVVAFLETPALIGVVLLLFGGLPLAVFGLLIDRQWTAIQTQPRRPLHMPYAVLMFQIVSMGLSAFGLAMMGDALVWALSEGMSVRLSDWFLPAYFALQILASVVVIPVWRRLVLSTPLVRTYSLPPTRA